MNGQGKLVRFRQAYEASLCPFPGTPAPESPYLVLLLRVLGKAAVQVTREFLEPLSGVGIGGVVFKAHGLIDYVLYQKKSLL